MKTKEEILSHYTGYSEKELKDRNTEPLIQPYDCFLAMEEYANQDQWISVEDSDNRPIVGEDVQCGHDTAKWVCTGSMDYRGNYSDDEGQLSPTHWQPLPKAPSK